MKFSIVECEQRSPEWHQARLGRLTGTAAKDMMTRIKSGESAARRDLRVRLALEIITGVAEPDDFQSDAMKFGVEQEAKALAIYEANTGKIIERTGFLACDDFPAGISLDGFVDNRHGTVEAKVPKPATHLAYLRSNEIPSIYHWQCLHGLWVTGADFCDFMSYHPFFPDELQYLCVRMERDERAILEYDQAVRTFLAEVRVEVDEIIKLQQARAA